MDVPVSQIGAVRTADRAAPAGESSRKEALARTCAEFEALFIQKLFQQMRATVPRTELFGGGQAEQLYTELRDAELARSLARGRGIGLATVLYRQLAKPPEPVFEATDSHFNAKGLPDNGR